ncbi:MAG: DUF2513 domain-containing protein [Rhizobiaceae bacterium]
MKRDMDLVRNILLEIESKDDGSNRWIDVDLPNVDQKILHEHLFLMWKSGLIEGNDGSTMSSREFMPRRLSWTGHDFLDSIRDPEIWQKTKDGAKAAGGFTAELLGELAKGLIKTQIKKLTGVEI